jgi:hypothetical protein
VVETAIAVADIIHFTTAGHLTRHFSTIPRTGCAVVVQGGASGTLIVQSSCLHRESLLIDSVGVWDGRSLLYDHGSLSGTWYLPALQHFILQ